MRKDLPVPDLEGDGALTLLAGDRTPLNGSTPAPRQVPRVGAAFITTYSLSLFGMWMLVMTRPP